MYLKKLYDNDSTKSYGDHYIFKSYYKHLNKWVNTKELALHFIRKSFDFLSATESYCSHSVQSQSISDTGTHFNYSFGLC